MKHDDNGTDSRRPVATAACSKFRITAAVDAISSTLYTQQYCLTQLPRLIYTAGELCRPYTKTN